MREDFQKRIRSYRPNSIHHGIQRIWHQIRSNPYKFCLPFQNLWCPTLWSNRSQGGVHLSKSWKNRRLSFHMKRGQVDRNRTACPKTCDAKYTTKAISLYMGCLHLLDCILRRPSFRPSCFIDLAIRWLDRWDPFLSELIEEYHTVLLNNFSRSMLGLTLVQ